MFADPNLSCEENFQSERCASLTTAGPAQYPSDRWTVPIKLTAVGLPLYFVTESIVSPKFHVDPNLSGGRRRNIPPLPVSRQSDPSKEQSRTKNEGQ